MSCKTRNMCDGGVHRTHAPRRVLNDPREREALGKTTEASRGELTPVHAAVRFDGGQMAMDRANVNRMLRGSVIFGQWFDRGQRGHRGRTSSRSNDSHPFVVTLNLFQGPFRRLAGAILRDTVLSANQSRGCAARNAPGHAARWTLKQVQGDGGRERCGARCALGSQGLRNLPTQPATVAMMLARSASPNGL